MSGQARVVLCTVPDAETGARLARALVEEGLAACVNLVPGIHSFYLWEGQVQSDAEQMLIIKTQQARLDQIFTRLAELHPYDVPELIALDVTSGSRGYLAWIDDSTR